MRERLWGLAVDFLSFKWENQDNGSFCLSILILKTDNTKLQMAVSYDQQIKDLHHGQANQRATQRLSFPFSGIAHAIVFLLFKLFTGHSTSLGTTNSFWSIQNLVNIVALRLFSTTQTVFVPTLSWYSQAGWPPSAVCLCHYNKLIIKLRLTASWF